MKIWQYRVQSLDCASMPYLLAHFFPIFIHFNIVFHESEGKGGSAILHAALHL